VIGPDQLLAWDAVLFLYFFGINSQKSKHPQQENDGKTESALS